METEMSENASLKYLSIRLDENKQKIIASFSPQGDTDTITSDMFMQAIDSSGLGGYSIHQPSLATATAEYNSGKPFEIIVGEAVDGKFSIRIDANLMSAYLSCTLPLGGAPIKKKKVL